MNQKTRKVAFVLTAVMILYSVMSTVTPADAAAGVSKGQNGTRSVEHPELIHRLSMYH